MAEEKSENKYTPYSNLNYALNVDNIQFISLALVDLLRGTGKHSCRVRRNQSQPCNS
jgi:hypothetical protein